MPQTIKEMFPAFYTNSTIQSIANKPKWTISDKDKRPVDMYEVKTRQRIIGCNAEVPFSTMTLDETVDIIPYPRNHAFLLDMLTDGFVILDIEPSCKPSLMRKFLMLPYLYGEKSLSGKGIHLVLPVPDCIDDYPIAKQKIKLQHKSGQYEILQNHWVTFTRNMLPNVSNPNGDKALWEKLYMDLAKEAKESAPLLADYDVLNEKIEDIPDAKTILDILSTGNPYKKTPHDFDRADGTPDMSRYETGWLSHKYNVMTQLLKASFITKNKHEYTLSEQTCLLAELARRNLEHRDKHDEIRTGMPYLLYTAQWVIMRTSPEEKE